MLGIYGVFYEIIYNYIFVRHVLIIHYVPDDGYCIIKFQLTKSHDFIHSFLSCRTIISVVFVTFHTNRTPEKKKPNLNVEEEDARSHEAIVGDERLSIFIPLLSADRD